MNIIKHLQKCLCSLFIVGIILNINNTAILRENKITNTNVNKNLNLTSMANVIEEFIEDEKSEEEIPTVDIFFEPAEEVKEEISVTEETIKDTQKEQKEEQKKEEPKAQEKNVQEEILPEDVTKNTSEYSILNSFSGDLTGYAANCPQCSGKLGCNGLNVLDGTTTYNDNTYGNVRIVAASKNLKCGSIVKFQSIFNKNEDIIAIVLDRGVGGTTLDLLVESEDYARKMVGRKKITYDVLRNGWTQ